jgi:hypothetical protein
VFQPTNELLNRKGPPRRSALSICNRQRWLRCELEIDARLAAALAMRARRRPPKWLEVSPQRCCESKHQRGSRVRTATFLLAGFSRKPSDLRYSTLVRALVSNIAVTEKQAFYLRALRVLCSQRREAASSSSPDFWCGDCSWLRERQPFDFVGGPSW